MSKKSSLFDDPLGDPFGVGNNNNDNEKKKGLIFDNSDNDDLGALKTVDSTKINLKKDKNKISVLQTSTNSKPITYAEKGLGFSTSLWDDDDDKKNKKGNDLLNEITLKPTTETAKELLFGNTSKTNTKDNTLEEIGIKINNNNNNKATTLGGKVNTGDVDDNKLDDLKVGKLIEKEDALDYDLFGKKNIVQARSVGTILHKQKNASEMVDLEVESADVLNNLEKVTLKNDNVFTSILPQKSSTKTEDVPPMINTDDIDISKFDINAYINNNSSNSGGLFD